VADEIWPIPELLVVPFPSQIVAVDHHFHLIPILMVHFPLCFLCHLFQLFLNCWEIFIMYFSAIRKVSSFYAMAPAQGVRTLAQNW
jgi:hypothetical protein